jgi:hypothetical protein
MAEEPVACSGMVAAAVLRDVFQAHRAGLGEEDDGFLFENGPAPVSRLDVLVYRPADGLDLTTFATIGMAVEEMPPGPGPGNGGRAELQLSRRGRLHPQDEGAVAGQLANLAIHPFVTGTQLSWGHMLGLGRDFPTFPGCSSVLFAGPLSSAGRDYLDTSAGPVRILNVLPITEAERDHARTMPPLEFVHQLMERADVFTGRPS